MPEKYCLLSCTRCGAQFNCTKQKQYSLTNSVAEIGDTCPLCGKGIVEYHKYANLVRRVNAARTRAIENSVNLGIPAIVLNDFDALIPECKEDENE